MPQRSFRPGIRKTSLDFPGGRIPANTSTESAIRKIIQRELHIEADDILDLKAINTYGWAINSSFSNQRLFGFVAKIRETIEFKGIQKPSFFPVSSDGMLALLNALDCLQCRAVMLEWILNNNVS